MPEQEEENKNLAYEHSRVLYDTDDFMLVEVENYDGAKYFGPNFVERNYFKNYNNGSLYFIINKKEITKNNSTYTIYIEDNGNEPRIFNPLGDNILLSEIIKTFPVLESRLIKIVGASSIYTALLSIKNGVETTSYQLQRHDDLISGFKFKEKSPGNSMVSLTFDNESKFFELFGFDENDMWALNVIMSRYGADDVFYSNDYAYSDFKEGYLIREFSNENMDKVKEIISYLEPSILPIKDENDKLENASQILFKTFESECESFINDYSSMMNNCRQSAALDDVYDDLGDVLIKYGMLTKTPLYKYYTTVSTLLALYDMTGEKDGNITDVLTKLLNDTHGGGWSDSLYEYDCKDFDSEGFNNGVSWELDKMLEQLLDSDKFANLEVYRKALSILDKYTIGFTYELPRNNKEKFKIMSLDPATNKFTIRYFSSENTSGIGTRNNPGELRSFTLDEFNNFLHTPELF